MTNKTRKRIGPVSLVMSLAIIGALAAFLVLVTNPGASQAQPAPPAPPADPRCEGADAATLAFLASLGIDCPEEMPTQPPPTQPPPTQPPPTQPPTMQPTQPPSSSTGSSVSGGENVEVPPGRPMNLTAEAYTDGIPQEEIQLTWDSPTDGGSTRQYRIDISENDGTTWYALESDVRNTRYLHDNLEANQTFTYRVFATNQHGISAVSNDDSGTTANSWVPARPARLTAERGY